MEPTFRKYNYYSEQVKSSLTPVEADHQENHPMSSLVLKNDSALLYTPDTVSLTFKL